MNSVMYVKYNKALWDWLIENIIGIEWSEMVSFSEARVIGYYPTNNREKKMPFIQTLYDRGGITEEEEFKRLIRATALMRGTDKPFAVGDYVVIVANRCNSHNKIGDVGVITKIKDGNGKLVWVEVDGGPRDNVYSYATDVRYATSEEMANIRKKKPEFSIGDIVVVIGNTNNSSNVVGDIGRVMEGPKNDTGSYKVDVKNRMKGGNWTRTDEIRHADEREKAIYGGNHLVSDKKEHPEEFMVGDVVVIVGNDSGSKNRIGDVGKITDRIDSDYRVQVVGGPTLCNFSNAKELRVASIAERNRYNKDCFAAGEKKATETACGKKGIYSVNEDWSEKAHERMLREMTRTMDEQDMESCEEPSEMDRYFQSAVIIHPVKETTKIITL